ncbi:MAG: dihydrofolate reductase, partial [Enterococcus aquimarinus]|nr:dihydrofolate reductase [Enterococcus aquimarinus]
MLAALWAEDLQGIIGKDQTLPWHLPNDLKYFKEMTIGKTIVMGRTTFEGMGSRPLPNRQTIVLTRNPDYQAEGVTVMHSVDDVLAYAKTKEEPTMIIGGAVVFQDFLPYYDLL